jgi:hypothetical protein
MLCQLEYTEPGNKYVKSKQDMKGDVRISYGRSYQDSLRVPGGALEISMNGITSRLVRIPEWEIVMA